jgi:hypothetical protein
MPGLCEVHAAVVPVPCVSVAAQRLFHTGHQLRGIGRHDLAVIDELDPRR